MTLHELNILNYKNIQETTLRFSDKLNCFVGLNGQGKTNVLDAIYYLSFTKSAYNTIDSQNISHNEDMAFIQGRYTMPSVPSGELEVISCGIKRGVKKQFRRGKKDYSRLIDHIGLIPLVMVSPQDSELISEGSDERRRFMDGVIAQYDKSYLEQLTHYNVLLKQRNALLKQYEDQPNTLPTDLFEVIEMQMAENAMYIYNQRTIFIQKFIPIFQEIYASISGTNEIVSIQYTSQLQERNLIDAFAHTRQRDALIGWTTQGIHKDDIDMRLGEHPLKRVGSQGQQKSYLLAMKLGQAILLGKPILLLDDIFDKLDFERVERIIQLVNSDRFGQIFITDTDRQHLTSILRNTPQSTQIYHVHNGVFKQV